MTKQQDVRTKDRAKKGPPGSVLEQKVRGADGRVKTMRFVDLGSPTLGDDLTYLFRKNVEKARRDNKRMTGSADGIRAGK